jgi:hypothetical protein
VYPQSEDSCNNFTLLSTFTNPEKKLCYINGEFSTLQPHTSPIVSSTLFSLEIKLPPPTPPSQISGQRYLEGIGIERI